MLKTLEDFFRENNYFFQKKVKKFDDSCCKNVDVKVLSFDRIKDSYCENFKPTSKPQSVDFVFISCTTDELFFIEMKYYNPADKYTCLKFVEKHFEQESLDGDDFDSYIPQKIIDSYKVIILLMAHHGIDKKFLTYFDSPEIFRIKPILLMNLTSSEYLDVAFASLNKRTVRLTRIIDTEIALLTCEAFYNKFTYLSLPRPVRDRFATD